MKILALRLVTGVSIQTATQPRAITAYLATQNDFKGWELTLKDHVVEVAPPGCPVRTYIPLHNVIYVSAVPVESGDQESPEKGPGRPRKVVI